MSGSDSAKFAQLTESDGYYVVVLLDEAKQPVGHGYRGPTLKRAQQDFVYWTRGKGLQALPAD
jgi:hypothetical protein